MHEIRALRLRVPLPADAAWLHEQVHAAAGAGFNTVILDTFSRGLTCFPSAAAREFGLLRLHSSFRRTDLLEVACHAARTAGIRMVAALDCLNAGSREEFPASPLGAFRFRALRATAPPGVFGTRRECESADWLLCACNPDLRDLLGSLAAEIADGYPVDGLLLSALQFGPEGGAHAGRCYCVNCTTPRKDGQEEDWDNRRLEEISELLSAIKARARTSRRTLRIWGELPLLPGSKDPQLVHREFDRELVEVCVAPMEIGEQVSGGIELAQFTVTDQNEIAPQMQQAMERFPFGFVCRWHSSALLSDLARPHAPLTNPALDREPLTAALEWLQQSASGENQPVRAKAGECLALLEAGGGSQASLEMAHALLETAIPQEGANVELDSPSEALVRAFALLRLAIMVRP